MIDRHNLLADLQRLLRQLEGDLRERCEVAEIGAAVKAEYDKAKKAERTAQSFEDWRSDYITQIGAAWILSCVFARFLEDNQLVDPPKLSGSGDRLQRARDEYDLYVHQHPAHTVREYLLSVFDSLAKLPGAKEVFSGHNLIHQQRGWLSADAAKELRNFWQRIDPNTGKLVHHFTDPDWDTRFLGDLYQDLSEAARKKYALLQTPEFVEEFILDRTLDPAIEEFGLDGFKMIDPACGSGHFLLGAFRRIADRWERKDPAAKCREVVQRALDSTFGVDVNPYAVAIARFRLLLAALRACGVLKLVNAPAFHTNVACGDSLYHGRQRQQTLGDDWTDEAHYFASEDAPELRRILREGTYHCVVANPPYITPKDRAANQAYRKLYPNSCHMKYSLAVPFMERLFRLAVSGVGFQPAEDSERRQAGSLSHGAGFVGQITANSFMKREFGKKLVESFFPMVDLTHVIDTSGAYIPGHGTPTVILLGRNRPPVSAKLRTVMGIRGEPSTPDDPSRGLVWSAILEQIDQPDSQSEFVSVGDSPRELFHKHPWSIGGGGAAESKERLEQTVSQRLGEITEAIGSTAVTGEDELFMQPLSTLQRARIEMSRPLVEGDIVRDWKIDDPMSSVFVGIEPGQRAFEIVLARKVAAGQTQTTWFQRHGSTPITELPAGWPDDYKRLVQRRIEIIESNPQIALIEQPEYKRRWNTEPWDSQAERALRGWLLDRLESYFDFDGRMKEVVSGQSSVVSGEEESTDNCQLTTDSPLREIQLVSVAKLADVAANDVQFMEVAEVYRDRSDFDTLRLVAELVESESVPLLPVLRYKPSDLDKRQAWERTWQLQRQEDAIDRRVTCHSSLVTGEETNDKGPMTNDEGPLTQEEAEQPKKELIGEIPVPPKYKSSDFQSSKYWRLRGKLDVPKERWVSFPHCEGEDQTLVIAWAGYDHLQLTKAIAAYFAEVQEKGGSDDPRLVPLLGCILELNPWVKQWHNDIDPDFGYRLGDYFANFVEDEARTLGKTVEDIRAWQPPVKSKKRKKKG